MTEWVREWRVRCPACGRTRDLREAGGFRIAPRWARKRTLGHCSGCGRCRWLIIEPYPERDKGGSDV